MQLPIGYDDFGEILENNLNFIDKSLFIKEIIDDRNTKAIVITRPRRFGKTFNLSLLHYFLAANVYGRATQGLFDKLNIATCTGSEKYMQHQGKYPVVSISFKDIKQATFSDVLEKFNELIIRVYDQHNYLETSDKLTSAQKELYRIILHRKANQSQLEGTLQTLTECLSIHHGIKPWLLIDEYDTPIYAAYAGNYYDEMIQFMRGLFSAALKNNPYLNKAVITGILRIAKESLFSGVNNLEVYPLIRNEYSKHFGFTETEVDGILIESHLLEKAAEIKAWYNGYQFGDTTIYNPWSIANCVKRKGTIEPYWINTSDNQLIKDLLKELPLEFKAQFEGLMRGEVIEQFIDESMVLVDLKKNPLAVWNLLLMSGYLTPVHCQDLRQGTLCQLRVPNQEVNNLYRNIIELWLSNGHGLLWYNQFTAALISGNMAVFSSSLQKIMMQIVSFHDLAKEPEAFFHGLLLGFIASLQETHEIKSNRESGLGRYDILLIPHDVSQLGIVIELKAKQPHETISLESLANMALEQIDEKRYTVEFTPRGITHILKIAIAFSGKHFVLRYAQESGE